LKENFIITSSIARSVNPIRTLRLQSLPKPKRRHSYCKIYLAEHVHSLAAQEHRPDHSIPEQQQRNSPVAIMAHSTTMAEERLFPSALDHKTSFTRIATKAHEDGMSRHTPEILGEGPGQVEPLGAFEVPKAKRLLQIALAVIYCLLSAGIVFGYAALKPILVSEGVYRDRCTPEEELEGVRVCYQQELRLNFMFTVAAVSTNVCALLVGTILDRWGPRVAGVIGSVLFGLGCAGMGFSKNIHVIDREYPTTVEGGVLTKNSISHIIPSHGHWRPFRIHFQLSPCQRLPAALWLDPVDAYRCL
jgi:hypothetical protein